MPSGFCLLISSPNCDNGYDVSDYYKVMEEAGTMEELEELIAACEKREIVVMMDLVLNHSSHLHPWFLEARKDRNSKYHDFYIWKEGTKEQPPEGGGAFFGGSTWNGCRRFRNIIITVSV